jgi:hypothetical protein
LRLEERQDPGETARSIRDRDGDDLSDGGGKIETHEGLARRGGVRDDQAQDAGGLTPGNAQGGDVDSRVPQRPGNAEHASRLVLDAD